MALILLAEDERGIADVIRLYLEHAGHRVLLAGNGAQAIEQHRRLAPDLALLDVKLPGCDGFDVLEHIRSTSDIPVLMVTALGDTDHRLAGLRGGADDYIVKPFDPRELVARVEAVLRRVASPRRSRLLRLGRLSIDREAGTATVDLETAPQPLAITPTQLRLLAHLIAHPGRIHTRSELADACLAADSDALERTVDSHLSKLRRRLARHGLSGMVEAVRSLGYRAAIP